MKRLAAASIAAVLMLSALAGPVLAKSEMPAPGDPGCVGKIIAIRNHISGNVTDNPNDSKGPGYFAARDILIAPTVKEALAIAREYCEVP